MPRKFVKLKFLVLVVCTALIINCGESACTAQSDKVVAAKSLTNEQLASLYHSALELMDNSENIVLKGDQIAAVFTDTINPTLIRVRSKSIWLYLETCSFDNKVVIFINTPSILGRGNITIRWGEGPTTQSIELWHQV
ncbi:hypothetical protein ACJJIR_01275 [Microbulbifer sp. SSSA008]|uniref:hypothetical protein n=1 Tax=Microbulbifer sp. SSSA008 TaxID=3243380 RepID=UPI0040391084